MLECWWNKSKLVGKVIKKKKAYLGIIASSQRGELDDLMGFFYA